MSSSTPNFNLTKPAGSENVDIATINSNMDKIDAGVEPIHATQTVTGTNGSITISNALDAPLLNFTATGMGTPGVVDATEIGGASAMGSQTWDSPMILDVPIGIIDTSGDPVFLDYGGGVGANSYKPTAGTEAGTTIWWNSAQLGKLFDEAEEAGDEGTYEGGTTLFTWTLPFSVAENSVVYCSHLKNQNVSGEEGIWASGNHMYLRIYQSHLPQNDFSDLARLMRNEFVNKVNYYDPFNPKGADPENWLDFWIMVTPSASYTKESDKKVFSLSSGSQMFLYFKITDYIAMVMEQQPSPTALTSVSVTYLTNVAANITQNAVMANAISAARQEPAALGSGAAAENGGAVGVGASETYGGGAVGYHAKAATGGAVGVNASSVNGQGGAVGMDAVAHDGGAVGYGASATSGGAIGNGAYATSGGAIGSSAHSSTGGAMGQECRSDSGGAVGYGAKTGAGCAIGQYAVCEDSHNDPIDAIQLGTGTNTTTKSMQVYGTQLLYYHSNDNTHYIPLSLITASYSKADPTDQALFKQALGIS